MAAPNKQPLTTRGPCSFWVPGPESQPGQWAGPASSPRPRPSRSQHPPRGPAPVRPSFSLEPGAPEKGGQPEAGEEAGRSQAPAAVGVLLPQPLPLPLHVRGCPPTPAGGGAFILSEQDLQTLRPGGTDSSRHRAVSEATRCVGFSLALT